jgi:hypothetical protein
MLNFGRGENGNLYTLLVVMLSCIVALENILAVPENMKQRLSI